MISLKGDWGQHQHGDRRERFSDRGVDDIPIMPLGNIKTEDFEGAKQKFKKVFSGPNFKGFKQDALAIMQNCRDAQQAKKLIDGLSEFDDLLNARSKGMSLKDEAIAGELKKLLNHPGVKSKKSEYSARTLDGNDVLLVHTILQGAGIDDHNSQTLKAVFYSEEDIGDGVTPSKTPDEKKETTQLAGEVVMAINLAHTDGNAKVNKLSAVDLYLAAKIIGAGAKNPDEQPFYYINGEKKLGTNLSSSSDNALTAFNLRSGEVVKLAKHVKPAIEPAVKLGPQGGSEGTFANAIIQRLKMASDSGKLDEAINRLNTDVLELTKNDLDSRRKQTKAILDAMDKNRNTIRDAEKPKQY